MIQDYKLRVNQAAWRKLNSTMYCDTCCDDTLIAAAILASRARRDARAGAARERTVFVLTQQEGISLTWILCRASWRRHCWRIRWNGTLSACAARATWYLCICPIYTMYIHEYIFMNIYNVYSCISHVYRLILEYTWHIHGIYMVYSWYILMISGSERYHGYILNKVMMGQLRTGTSPYNQWNIFEYTQYMM